MQFAFQVRDPQGTRMSGMLDAVSQEAALVILAQRHLMVTELKPVTGLPSSRARISGEELLVFTQELAAMLKASLPLLQAMDVLAQDAQNPRLREVVLEMASGLSAGNTLSELMRRHPNIFSTLYVSLVAAGETAGTLPIVLERLAVYVRRMENLKRKVRAALMYPSVVVAFAVFMLAMMFMFGIPQLEQIYGTIGAQLPLATRLFIGLSHLLLNGAVVWAPLLVGGIVLVLYWKQTDSGQRTVDRILLNLYIVGPLLLKAAIARFARTLSTLYASGVPIVQALEVAAATTGNRVIGDAALGAVAALKQGSAIAAALRESRVFTSMTLSMVGAGEQSGTLESMLERLADFYEEQVEVSTQALAGLIEPLVMIFVGLAIGTMIIVLALPFFLIGSQLH